MADEEKTENEGEETAADAAPEAADDAAAEVPAAEAPAEEAPAEEAPAEEAPAEAAPAEERPAEDESPAEEAEPAAEAPAAPSEDAEPAETLTPKQLRKRERSTFSGEPRPERNVEERVSERAETRAHNAANRRRYRERMRAKHAEESREGTPAADRPPGPKKVRLGRVVSTKADKTITVKIEVARRHPTYEKVVRRSATLHAHDAENAAGEGDTVRIVETRPLSKTKRWRLLEIVEKAR